MSPRDAALSLGGSLILHGPVSDRAYLARLDPGDAPAVLRELDRLAAAHGYGKLFAKVPQSCAPLFHEAGYVTEALVPGMFPCSGPADGPDGQAREPGLFVSRFEHPARAREPAPEEALQVLRLAGAKARQAAPAPLPAHWRIEPLGPDLAGEMARLYDDAFSTYPFPINDPAYLRQCMAGGVHYYGVRSGNDLMALSACETDPAHGLVEMTDFGSLPEARGRGAAFHLLERMERDMGRRGLALAFTISRALSAPINVSFARRGYGFAGTLLANTNISGGLESMNIWFKPLQHQDIQRI